MAVGHLAAISLYKIFPLTIGAVVWELGKPLNFSAKQKKIIMYSKAFKLLRVLKFSDARGMLFSL